MTNTGSGAAIYFTLDGSSPDFTDIPYTGPFTLTSSATIRAIAYNAAYTDSAEAAPITVQIAPTYPLAASTPGGGSVSVSPAAYSDGNRYVSNTVVTLTATPASGWSFLHWTGDSSETTNVTTVLMDRPRAVQAVFGTSLNLFTNGNGQLLLNPATGPYAFGSTVQLTALPAPGAYFFGWAGAASGFSNPLFITATNASGLTALFGALNASQVSLTVLPNGNGTVSVSPGKNVYTNGETVTLTAWPGANQRFANWSGDASGNLNPLQLTLTASQVITANFVPGAATNPPVITQPPLSRTLSAGANTLLSFALTGDGPFAYQWRLNSSPLSGATNPALNLIGISSSEAGRYDVVVIGAGGSATSAPASVALLGLEMVLSSGPHLPLLTLDCAPGTSFQLEYSWDLSPTNWNLLAPVTLSGNRLYYVDSPDTNDFRRFYRAVPQ
ncbi:MAG: chitobiase/beta-hexosaminidase C-terminal domain-containing protein [Verrucomicrobia bacterium]|nr:chitobiase/beta-hexosaminidase C-terminal domain-containing protein [Verrucomicrobiota bacterium]